MDSEFKNVPYEVEILRQTGIFDKIAYTHVSSHSARSGVEKIRRLVSLHMGYGYGIVPFSGEFGHENYIIRANCVSLTPYSQLHTGSKEHNWRRYVKTSIIPWNPERNDIELKILEEKIKALRNEPTRLRDIKDPTKRSKLILGYEGLKHLEMKRIEAYEKLSDEEKKLIRNPKPEIYVFGMNISKRFVRRVLGKEIHGSHPLVEAEINLERELMGMFTSLEVNETRGWISRALGREIPVGSIDALATYEGNLTLNV